MKKTLLTIFCSLLFALTTFAQKQSPPAPDKPGMSIFVEAGGPGVISFNYDTRFTASDKGIGGRIGVGGFKANNSGSVYVPVGLTYLLSKNNKDYFEIGTGFTYVNYTMNADDVIDFSPFKKSFGHLNFGYRYQQKEGGLIFRVAFNPVFGDGFFNPAYGGIALGYKF